MSASTVVHRGCAIAFETHGSGPPVILQHGFLSNRRSWVERGVVAELAPAYTTILVDSLGHGDSDKPADPPAYRRELRAGDIAAVLDTLGVDRAHYVGYSMGAWIGTGMARFQARRLRSIALGGWDPVRGPASPRPASTPMPPLEPVVERATTRSPSLTAWIQPDHLDALRGCLAALADVEGSIEALAACGVPVRLWAAVDDPWHAGVQEAAGRLPGATFASVSGDHIGAVLDHGPDVGRMLRAFLDSVPAR